VGSAAAGASETLVEAVMSSGVLSSCTVSNRRYVYEYTSEYIGKSERR
jgi:hypothetical protein